MRNGRCSLGERRSGRPAFTVLELIVALTLGALVIVAARALLETIGEHALRVTATAGQLDADANGERLLRTLAGRLEIGADSADTFGGDASSLSFSSWCQVPRGWLEPCRVRLALVPDHTGVAIVARLSTGENLTIRRGAISDGFRYLASPAAGGSWYGQWGRGLSAPLAFGIIIDGDTMIVRVGERG